MAGSEAHGPRAVRVTPEDVRRLCEFLYRRTGMIFNETKRYYVERRVADRMGATGSASFASYFARLRADTDNEVEHLINAFTVNETTEDIGARRLHTILETVLEHLSFEGPDLEEKHVVVDRAYVERQLEDIVKDQNLSRYIL